MDFVIVCNFLTSWVTVWIANDANDHICTHIHMKVANLDPGSEYSASRVVRKAVIVNMTLLLKVRTFKI